MITTNKLPLMKRVRYKVIMKHDPHNKRFGSLVIVNTMSLTGLKEKFGLIDIEYNNMFKSVYAKRREQLKIGTRNVVKNRLDQRQEYYANIATELPFVTGINEGKLAQKFNLFFFLDYANTLFIENTTSITKLKKPAMYWNYLQKYMDEVTKLYKDKTMIINIDEFSNTMVEDLAGRNDGNLNPIAYLYLLMKREPEEFYKIGDIDIVLTSTNGGIMRINPEQCKVQYKSDKKTDISRIFRKEIFRLMNRRDPEDAGYGAEIDELVTQTRNELTQSISADVLSAIYGATGDVPDDIKEKVEKQIEKTVDKIAIEKGGEASAADVHTSVSQDEELLKEIVKSTVNKPMKTSAASSKRDELLREKQLELTLRGKTLEDILKIKSEAIDIPVNDVADKVETLNHNMTDVRFPNINKTYVDELMEKDLVNMFTDMNNKSIKVFVRSIDVEDTSDISNYKETWTIELEDELRVRHKLVFDVPKVIDGKFLYLGGNRKYINNQQLLLPIVKVEPDTVQLVSNYNKIFIRRYGDKVSSTNEKLKKALSEEIKGIRVQRGKYDTENKSYVTTIDYDDLSTLFKEINISGTRLIFDQREIRNILLNANIKGLEDKLDKELLPLGIKGNTYYCVDLTTDNVVVVNLNGKTESTGKTLTEFILSLSPALDAKVGDQSAGKKYMYSRATIMSKQVPIVLLLCYFEGIDGFLNRAGIKYYFSDTRPRISSDEGIVRFSDGYLVYTSKPMANSLLMNGFVDIPTENYTYGDFNDKFMYQEVFETMFGRRNIANAFDNFLDNFIDPMTMDVLVRLSLPTDITGMILYGNELLADNQYTPNEICVSRIRSAEVISAIVYKNVAKAYEKYKETSSYKNPIKMSIQRNAIIKEVLAQQTVENYSELNPISEQQKLRCCLRKGPSGCNLAQAYNETQRSYHPAMVGLFTLASTPDANVGVNRFLTMEPPISDPRGFIDNKALQGKVSEYNDVNLFGVAESLTPGCTTGDDSPRTTMTTAQSGHSIPVAKADPVLVSNGAERVLPYHVSKDWVFVAKEDGVVKEYNTELGLLIVQYKSGECEAVNLKRIAKNGAGGFCVSKEMLVNFKQEQKFKKNDILAYDSKFFSENPAFGNRFCLGSFQKIALLSTSLTYEDSSYISKKMSREMATEVVMDKQVVLGTNTNVDFMVKVGDKVQSGDELIRFERSFDEDSLNTLLLNVGNEMKEDIMMSSKDKVKSKYSGVIEDIRVYCTVDLDQLSPSLRKIVSTYYSKIRSKKKLLEQYDDKGSVVKCGMIFNEPTGKVETNDGKFRGAVVNDGVLIEFSIKVHDEVGVGDKIVFYSALKSIVGNIIEEGQEAYTLYRPEEKIDAVLSCNSLISRGISSAPKMLMSNKLLVELSRKLKDIYDRK